MDLSHLADRPSAIIFSPTEPPASFDWRDSGVVTPVKNQGSCGACYAFASIGNIESWMAIEGEGIFDFSENNAKECNYAASSCSGSNYYDMANFFSTYGTVLEACDPYVAADVSCNSSCAYIKTLLGWGVISSDYVPVTADLKNYIQLHGPVYSTLYAGDSNDPTWSDEYDAYDGSYVLFYETELSSPTRTPNHAVLIIGWDDTASHAGGTGGWIVKNSWGTGWGGTCGFGTEGGYFKIAYGSANIGMWSSFIDAWQDDNPNETLMLHDEGGWATRWGYGGTTAWGLCKFVPSSDGYVTRVDFWATDATTDVDVYLYDHFDGSNLTSLMTSELNSSFTEAGYHSVSLTDPPQVSAGDDIYAAVKITNATGTYPIVSDINSGQTATTWMSGTGSSWYDMGLNQDDDVAIRIRLVPSLGASVGESDETLPDKFELNQNYPNPFNPSTTITYSLAAASRVTITVYNLRGQKVTTLVDRMQPAGDYIVSWNGTDASGNPVASGLYLYRLWTGTGTEVRKMLLVK
jgi:C1A family cysteine protease